MRQQQDHDLTSGSTPQLRVLVVDDNALFRTHLTRWLAHLTPMDVVGQASSGRDAVELAVQLRPDVILMDTSMMPMNGFEAVRQIKQAQVRSRIVLMATNRREEYAEEFIFFSDGFLQKDEIFTELIPLLAGMFPYCRLSESLK
jgi:DNA-binding NarL/FixJ family response regulator